MLVLICTVMTTNSLSMHAVCDLLVQVCSHIVDGIRKEAARVREEWDNCGGNPAFEDGRSVLHKCSIARL